MQRKADAYAQLRRRRGDRHRRRQALPKVVAEAAAPMAKIDQMTVISTDGASQTVRSVASTVAQGSEMLKALFGVDLAELVQGFGAKGSNGNGAEAAADPPPPPALDPAAS